jgi:U3 small nucleolar ribonucleoprotein component
MKTKTRQRKTSEPVVTQTKEELIESLVDSPSLLFLNPNSKDDLYSALTGLFDSQNKKSKAKLVFDRFGVHQIWNQLVHHTESSNTKTLSRLSNIIEDSKFEEELDQLIETAEKQAEEESDLDEEEGELMEAEEGEEELDEDEAEMNKALDKFEKDKLEEEVVKSMGSDELDEYMEEMEEIREDKKKLKMPFDVEGDDEVDYGDDVDMGEEGEEEIEEKEMEKEDAEDHENEVFALARENKEMALKQEGFANQEMVDKINKLEDEMMDDKKWQMKGEAECKDRNYNSLLEEYLDFDTAQKLQPAITKETTNKIEALIKQRVLDELFDDPVRKTLKGDKKHDDFELDFTKSGKGLGDQYADDYAKKLIAQNKDVFLENDLTGADSSLKHEI